MGWKRLKLAAEADIALNSVRNYEDGLTSPSIQNLRKIAIALGVDVGWLIDGDRVKETA